MIGVPLKQIRASEGICEYVTSDDGTNHGRVSRRGAAKAKAAEVLLDDGMILRGRYYERLPENPNRRPVLILQDSILTIPPERIISVHFTQQH